MLQVLAARDESTTENATENHVSAYDDDDDDPAELLGNILAPATRSGAMVLGSVALTTRWILTKLTSA
jgi:hypothetical protein